MSTEIKKEVKVKVLTAAEKAKEIIDGLNLSAEHKTDLSILLQKDIKKEVKGSAKKVKKSEDEPKQEVNAGLGEWHQYLAHLRTQIKELNIAVKPTQVPQLGSYLKRKELYPIDKLSTASLKEEVEAWSDLSDDEKKAPEKVKKSAHKVGSSEHLSGAKSAAKTKVEVKKLAHNVGSSEHLSGATEEVKPAIVKKVVAKKVKEEIVVRPPEEGTYYKQTIKGKEYLTLAIDGDDMIYVFDLSKKAVGGYDVNKKEIDQSIQVEFEEE
jgi:hypothetical protein